MNGYSDDDFNDWLWNTVLSGFTYDDYQGIYDSNGGSATQGLTAINNGVSIVNYTGHGSISSWGNGAPISASQVNSLSNNNKLPFVITVGCNVGEFNNSTSCFAETWLRATSNGEPTGAIAHFGSTISQSWEPPMHGQWAMNKILTESYENNISRSLGGITTNGCMHMNDAQGSNGQNETKYWTFFGDPSIWLRTDQPSSLSIYHDNAIMIGQSEFIVDTGVDDVLVSFSRDGELISSQYSEGGIAIMDLSSATNQPGELDLVVTGFNAIPYITSISVMSTDGAYLVMDEYALNNTEINAGSSLLIDLIFENIGNDDASDVSVSLSSESDYISIQDGTDYISYLSQGGSTTVGPFAFNVSTSAPFGHQFSLDFAFGNSDDSWSTSIDMTVGELIESFETGDFSYLPWEFTGDADWTIQANDASTGIYSARSGLLQDAEEGQNVTSDLILNITTVEDGSISFSSKTSCEDVGSSSGNYYDYLAFYIDGVEQNKWAGESSWSNVSFPISEGEHQLMWRFNKDQGVTSGSDAVWIDNIIFPPCNNLSGSTLGDLNSDGDINVLDVITLVYAIVDATDLEGGDLNGDGAINVADAVALVNIILGSGRVADATSASMILADNSVSITSDGYIGGIQMTLSHDNGFELNLTNNAMVAEYKTSGTSTILVVVEPNDELIFTTNQSFEIVEMIVANSNDEIEVNTISEFGLSSAYPNPFNPSTSVSLTVPSADYVSVKVYNLMGQMVGTLAEGMMEASVYTFTWDASDMSSGVYLIKAESSSSVDIQKVLLVK